MKIENRMVNSISIWKTCALAILMIVAFSCSKEESTENNKMPFSITIKPVAFGASIDTTKTYVNGSGEAFKISRFKCYISAITFKNKAGQWVNDSSYHLIDMLDTTSQVIKLNVEKGIYDSLEFSVGIDSLHNVSGAQSGALDPMLGMFWTWNTGYIYVKFEGSSPVSSAPNQRFTYHIGGFRTGENALRKIRIPLTVDIEKQAGLICEADVSTWFDGPYRLKLSDYPTVMTPGNLSMKFADNYATMFSLTKIINR